MLANATSPKFSFRCHNPLRQMSKIQNRRMQQTEVMPADLHLDTDTGGKLPDNSAQAQKKLYAHDPDC